MLLLDCRLRSPLSHSSLVCMIIGEQWWLLKMLFWNKSWQLLDKPNGLRKVSIFLYFVFCSLMTACCLQETASVQIFNPCSSSVLGFRGRLSCRLYHLVTHWRFWFLGQQSDGQMWKLWSIVSLSEHVSFLFAARSEALMKEVERLSYQHQQQLPPLSPPGFDIPQKKFSKWDLGPQQQHSPLSPTGYELLKQQFSKLDLGAQHQQQQLPPLSPTGYELQLQRFSKVDLGSQ